MALAKSDKILTWKLFLIIIYFSWSAIFLCIHSLNLSQRTIELFKFTKGIILKFQSHGRLGYLNLLHFGRYISNSKFFLPKSIIYLIDSELINGAWIILRSDVLTNYWWESKSTSTYWYFFCDDSPNIWSFCIIDWRKIYTTITDEEAI